MSIDEKRRSARYIIKEPIEFAFLSSDRFFKSSVVDCSKDGLCFKSNYEIKSRANIYIVGENSHCVRGRACALDGFAEVKWCRKQSNTPALFFLIGAEYRELEVKEAIP
jgi:hypothetical protein